MPKIIQRSARWPVRAPGEYYYGSGTRSLQDREPAQATIAASGGNVVPTSAPKSQPESATGMARQNSTSSRSTSESSTERRVTRSSLGRKVQEEYCREMLDFDDDPPRSIVRSVANTSTSVPRITLKLNIGNKRKHDDINGDVSMLNKFSGPGEGDEDEEEEEEEPVEDRPAVDTSPSKRPRKVDKDILSSSRSSRGSSARRSSPPPLEANKARNVSAGSSIARLLTHSPKVEASKLSAAEDGLDTEDDHTSDDNEEDYPLPPPRRPLSPPAKPSRPFPSRRARASQPISQQPAPAPVAHASPSRPVQTENEAKSEAFSDRWRDESAITVRIIQRFNAEMNAYKAAKDRTRSFPVEDSKSDEEEEDDDRDREREPGSPEARDGDGPLEDALPASKSASLAASPRAAASRGRSSISPIDRDPDLEPLARSSAPPADLGPVDGVDGPVEVKLEEEVDEDPLTEPEDEDGHGSSSPLVNGTVKKEDVKLLDVKVGATDMQRTTSRNSASGRPPPRKKRKWLKRGEVDPDDHVAVARQRERHWMIDRAIEDLDKQYQAVKDGSHAQLKRMYAELDRRRKYQLDRAEARNQAVQLELKDMNKGDAETLNETWQARTEDLAREMLVETQRRMSALKREKVQNKMIAGDYTWVRTGAGGGGWNFATDKKMSEDQVTLVPTFLKGVVRQRKDLSVRPSLLDPESIKDDIKAIDCRQPKKKGSTSAPVGAAPVKGSTGMGGDPASLGIDSLLESVMIHTADLKKAKEAPAPNGSAQQVKKSGSPPRTLPATTQPAKVSTATTSNAAGQQRPLQGAGLPSNTARPSNTNSTPATATTAAAPPPRAAPGVSGAGQSNASPVSRPSMSTPAAASDAQAKPAFSSVATTVNGGPGNPRTTASVPANTAAASAISRTNNLVSSNPATAPKPAVAGTTASASTTSAATAAASKPATTPASGTAPASATPASSRTPAVSSYAQPRQRLDPWTRDIPDGCYVCGGCDNLHRLLPGRPPPAGAITSQMQRERRVQKEKEAAALKEKEDRREREAQKVKDWMKGVAYHHPHFAAAAASTSNSNSTTATSTGSAAAAKTTAPAQKSAQPQSQPQPSTTAARPASAAGQTQPQPTPNGATRSSLPAHTSTASPASGRVEFGKQSLPAATHSPNVSAAARPFSTSTPTPAPTQGSAATAPATSTAGQTDAAAAAAVRNAFLSGRPASHMLLNHRPGHPLSGVPAPNPAPAGQSLSSSTPAPAAQQSNRPLSTSVTLSSAAPAPVRPAAATQSATTTAGAARTLSASQPAGTAASRPAQGPPSQATAPASGTTVAAKTAPTATAPLPYGTYKCSSCAKLHWKRGFGPSSRPPAAAAATAAPTTTTPASTPARSATPSTPTPSARPAPVQAAQRPQQGGGTAATTATGPAGRSAAAAASTTAAAVSLAEQRSAGQVSAANMNSAPKPAAGSAGR